MLPLDGIRILDLSRAGPGPYCTMLLADMGADVIRIEEPAVNGRRADTGSARRKFSERFRIFDALGRNKRSITLNLKSDAARQVFYEMVKSADVVVEGFRPGVSERLAVDYATLKQLNPRIVYCSISGYGQDGPYRGLAGHDINYLGIAGVLDLPGHDGRPTAVPGGLIGDYGAGGMHAVMGITVALLARERTGIGQYVDVSVTDSVLSLMAQALSSHFAANGTDGSEGESFSLEGLPHYGVYDTKDGKQIALGSIEPWLYAGLCRALGREDFIEHQNNPAKRDEIRTFFEETFKTKTRDEWFEHMQQFDNCVAPVNSLDEVLRDPQVVARNMLVELEHPELGKVPQVGVSVKFSETPGAVRSLASARGHHTEEILRDLGYAESDIQLLREQGAL